MPCFIGCLAMGFPRLTIVLVVIFSDYIGAAYTTLLLPVLGFFFLPLTTLAWAWAWHQSVAAGGSGTPEGLGLVVVVFAVLIDLDLIGTGASSGKRTVTYQNMTGSAARPRKRVKNIHR